MRTRSKLALIGLGATLIMAFAMSTASARNLSISNERIRVTFNILELGAEGISTTTCHVTLEGSLHSRTINKTAESLVGNITRVTTGSCNNPVTILTATLPWNIRYESFSGRLPNITLLTLRVVNASFQIGAFGLRCLARANIRARFNRDTTTRELTSVEVPFQEGIPLTGFLCPATGEFRSVGNGNIMLLGATTRITVTLI